MYLFDTYTLAMHAYAVQQVFFVFVLVLMLIMSRAGSRRVHYLFIFLLLYLVCLMGIFWYPYDNHHWLYVIWMSSIGALLCVNTNEKYVLPEVKKIGVILMAWTMLVSVFQKILHGQYFNGEFFTYTFLTDGRFFEFTNFLTGVSLDSLIKNIENISSLTYQPILRLDEYIEIVGVPEVLPWAVGVSFWVLGIEVLVGLLYIWGYYSRVGLHLAHGSLWVFIITTYVVAPVFMFAYLLSLWAYAIEAGSSEVRVFWIRLWVVMMIFIMFAHLFVNVDHVLNMYHLTGCGSIWCLL